MRTVGGSGVVVLGAVACLAIVASGCGEVATYGGYVADDVTAGDGTGQDGTIADSDAGGDLDTTQDVPWPDVPPDTDTWTDTPWPDTPPTDTDTWTDTWTDTKPDVPPSYCGDGICMVLEINSCPEDCPKEPICGNGKCEPGEEKNCPLDCAIQPKCGNGACEPGESPVTCPMDCGGNDPMACASQKCPKQWEICKSNPTCGKVLECAVQCSGSLDCIQMCALQAGPEGLQSFMPLIQCAQQAGCISGGPQCGNGACEDGEYPDTCPQDCNVPDMCGDGNCSDFESHDTCPSDCGPPGDPIGCAKQMCPKEYMMCTADKACGGLLNCLATCGSDACAEKCLDTFGMQALVYFQPLGECAVAKGCNGEPNTCGDGQCQDGEQETCPEDCAEPQIPCKTIKDCPSGNVCCNTGNQQICVPSGTCG